LFESILVHPLVAILIRMRSVPLAVSDLLKLRVIVDEPVGTERLPGVIV
jgi:hypothetical protein